MKSLPSWAEKFLRHVCPDDTFEQIEGDLIEMYNHEVKTLGKRKAQWSFVVKVMKFVRPGILFRNKHGNRSSSMFLHNIKTSFRSMRRDKLFAGINIAGLSIGITCSLLILAWVQYQYSYNDFIGNLRDIQRVKLNINYSGVVHTEVNHPLPLYYALREYDSRIKDVCFTSNCFGHTLSFRDKKIAKEVLAVSEEFLEMFDIPIIKGDYNSLDDPYSIMLNESTAKEFFGDTDPIGQFITYENEAELKVTGVYKDVPHNSDYWFMALIPTSYEKKWINDDKDKWDTFYPQIYLRLHDNSQAPEVNASIKDLIKIHFDDGSHPEIFLHKLEREHLYENFEDSHEAGGKIEYVRLFTWIALIILLIACINYVNLSTARSERRAREVGIRKAIGSRRGQLIRQFMTESVMTTSIALLIAMTAVALLLPWYNSLVHAQLTMNIYSVDFWLIALAVFSITTILSGFYPAFFFSLQKPVDVLRGKVNAGRNTGLFRKILVTTQFSVAIFLAIGVMVVYQQLEHVRGRNLGYDNRNLLSFPGNQQMNQNYNAIKDELLKSGVVESVTRSNQAIDSDYFTDYVEWPGKATTDKIQFSRVSADHDFATTMRLRIVAGRDFSPLLKSDTGSVVINETAARLMGFKNPIGETIKTMHGDLTIIGITQDVVRGSPFDKVQPCYIELEDDFKNSIMVRLSETNDILASREKVNNIFKRLDPLNPVDSWFIDDNFKYNIRDVDFIGELSRIFAALAVFLTCLGVVGLAAYTAEQRRKEIAIRKILGATISSVLMLLSNYFVRAAMLAVIVSAPIAWFAMDSYLQEFYYHIEVPWWVVPATAGFMLAITLAIVFAQTYKAAGANPVNGLRSE